LVAITVVAIAAVCTVAAAEEKLTKDQIDQQIERLGDNSIEVREQATKTLWTAGRAALPALEAAAKDAKDREVRERAGSLVEKVRLGITPEMTPEQAQRIFDYHAQEFTARRNLLQQLVDSGDSESA